MELREQLVDGIVSLRLTGITFDWYKKRIDEIPHTTAVDLDRVSRDMGRLNAKSGPTG